MCERRAPWKRYLFVPQRELEAALAAGVKSLAELAESLVAARPEPQLRLVSFEDERVKREAFRTLLPVCSLKAAAGYFGNGETVDPEGWVEADGVGKLDKRCLSAVPSAARWSRPFTTGSFWCSGPTRWARAGAGSC